MWTIEKDVLYTNEEEIDLILGDCELPGYKSIYLEPTPGDLLTYDKYDGGLLEILAVEGKLVRVKLYEGFDRGFLQKGIHLFKKNLK